MKLLFEEFQKKQYFEEIAKLDKEIEKVLHKNQIAENISNESIKHFVTTSVQTQAEENEME